MPLAKYPQENLKIGVNFFASLVYAMAMLNGSVIDNLKKIDPDRYRASLFADNTHRERLAVIYAFHAELAKVPEIVSEPMLGAIRYQWWRDAVAEIYSAENVRAHEVTTPLQSVIKNTDIPRFWLDKLINGRERDLDPTPFEGLDSAVDYCRNTSGVLIEIASQSVSPETKMPYIGMLGEAWGLVGLARAWSYYRSTMLSNLDFEGLCDAAQSKYSEASQGLGRVSSEVVPAIAYTALIPEYLKRLRRDEFDPSTDKVNYQAYRKQWRLMQAVMRGRI